MDWHVIYHPKIQADLIALGSAEARDVLTVITDRIKKGEPDKIGKPLSGLLVGCRRIRSGSTRIIYRVNTTKKEVLIIAAGMRRDKEVYTTATRRK